MGWPGAQIAGLVVKCPAASWCHHDSSHLDSVDAAMAREPSSTSPSRSKSAQARESVDLDHVGPNVPRGGVSARIHTPASSGSSRRFLRGGVDHVELATAEW